MKNRIILVLSIIPICALLCIGCLLMGIYQILNAIVYLIEPIITLIPYCVYWIVVGKYPKYSLSRNMADWFDDTFPELY